MYSKTQPKESRKSGFGTHDASRRDEFTSHVRTEQYRETLTHELHLLDKIKQKSTMKDEDDEEEDPTGTSSSPIQTRKTFLYDIGRTAVTDFNPKLSRDSYYSIKSQANKNEDKRNGGYVVTSQSFGIGIDSNMSACTKHTRNSATKHFADHSHLQV